MKRSILICVFLAVVAGGLSGILCAKYAAIHECQNISDVKHEFQNTNNSRTILANSLSVLPDFTFAAENSVAAVVHVTSTFQRRQDPSISILEYFFGYRTPQYEMQPAIGSGSGVAITTDGYIVTNNHVIEKASEIHVTLYDKRTFYAKLVGADPATDIAVLKIDANELPFIPFGNSDSLKLGEWILAIGNPYHNLNSTITAGIVSAKGRHIMSSDGRYRIESFIQTDAAVNPGCSGGALVNTRGELVGINTAIASPTGSFAGYSFAVPMTIVKKVVEDIIQYGMVQRAMLGVIMADITDALAKRLDLKTLNGVLITDVITGGVADKSGIKQGDVITNIGGTAIKNMSTMQEQISRYRPDQQVEIIVERNGKERYFNVVLEAIK